MERKGDLTLADYSTWYVDKAEKHEDREVGNEQGPPEFIPEKGVFGPLSVMRWIDGRNITHRSMEEREDTPLALSHSLVECIRQRNRQKKTGRVFISVWQSAIITFCGRTA